MGIGLIVDERDRSRVRAERRSRERESSGGGLERFADRIPPAQGITAVVHLVQDHQGWRRLGSSLVQCGVRGHLRIGERYAVVMGRVAPLSVAKVRVDRDTNPGCGVGPLRFEVLGGSDNRDAAHHPTGKQLGCDAQREGGLSGTRRCHGEKVARVLLEVRGECCGLPGSELPCGSPRCSRREGR